MYKSNFGSVIRRLRLQRQLTQEQLASLSDLERTFISMLERGIKQPSLKTISDLAKAFGLKNYELLHLVEQEIHSDMNPADSIDLQAEQQRLDALDAEQEQCRIGEIANTIPVVFFARTPMPEFAATFVSRNVTQLLGRNRESLLGSSKTWLEDIHPEDRAGVLGRLESMAANTLINHEYRIKTAHGRWLHVREELRLVTDESGLPKEVLGTMTGDLPES